VPLVLDPAPDPEPSVPLEAPPELPQAAVKSAKVNSALPRATNDVGETVEL
jgi:hypothetical protein